MIRPGLFAYVPTGEAARVDWHLNFSDPHLFVAYGSPLLARDELQVAEHPILGSIREEEPSVSAILDRLVEGKFRWGTSDGN